LCQAFKRNSGTRYTLPLVYVPLFFAVLALTSLANLHHSYFAVSHFPFNAHWLTAFICLFVGLPTKCTLTHKIEELKISDKRINNCSSNLYGSYMCDLRVISNLVVKPFTGNLVIHDGTSVTA